MRKTVFLISIGLLFLSLSAFAFHKFYVSIYQINFVPEKKMLQITGRIFIDDLNTGLQHHFSKKTHIGESGELAADVDLMKKYFNENFTISVNGQPKTINYLSKEMDGNVVVCYFNVRDISKITSLEIRNAALIELNDEQQNIMQVKVNGQKESLLLKDGEVKGMLKF